MSPPTIDSGLVLVDTSVWIEVFAKPQRLDLESIVSIDQVVTCLPVIQEVLQGFRDEAAFRIAREAMRSLPVVESPMEESVFIEAANLYRSARRSGITVRSSVDCLIATCALRGGLSLLHADRDFGLIAQVEALDEHDIHRSS